MTDEEKKTLEQYKIELLKVYDKSQENFEKQLSYISAGGLGLSMAFIDKIVKNITHSSCKILLPFSWTLLGLALIVNLMSHLISSRFTYNTINEIDNSINGIAENSYNYKKAISRNKIISKINLSCIISLLLGVICLILFVTYNL